MVRGLTGPRTVCCTQERTRNSYEKGQEAHGMRSEHRALATVRFVLLSGGTGSIEVSSIEVLANPD
jgi:hypothetical protein